MDVVNIHVGVIGKKRIVDQFLTMRNYEKHQSQMIV